MNTNNFFVNNIEEYNKFYKLVDDCFYVDRELPNQVFKDNYSTFLFQEFEFIMMLEFWTYIKELSKITNDELIILGVLDPDPISYYYHCFEYFNWIKLPTSITYDKYIEQIETAPKESEADSIFYNSFAIVIAPISKKWCIWADRHFETCIIAFQKDFFSEKQLCKISMFKKIDYALDSWMHFTLYKDDDKTRKVISKFKKNYTY